LTLFYFGAVVLSTQLLFKQHIYKQWLMTMVLFTMIQRDDRTALYNVT